MVFSRLVTLLTFYVGHCTAQTLFPVQRDEYITHSLVPSEDDSCTEDEQSTSGISYTLYGATYDGYFACTNGLVSFSDSFVSFTPYAFPVSNVPLVAPFWADVDLRLCNPLEHEGCSYHKHYVGEEANIIDSVIQTQFGYPSFEAVGAIVQTWDQVGYYNRKSDLKNTFQTVIVTNEVETFACFYYEQIEWVTGEYSYAPAQCGFDAGDDENHVTIPGSLTEDIRDVEGHSFCFRISDEVICQAGEVRENGECVPAGCSYFPNQISNQESLGAGVITASNSANACNSSGVEESGNSCTLSCASGYQPTYSAGGEELVATCVSGSFLFYDNDGSVVDPTSTALCQQVDLVISAPDVIETYEAAALASATSPISVSLTAPPTGIVIVQATVNDTSEVMVSPTNMTFTAANYNLQQSVSITAVGDGLDDGDINWILTFEVVDSDESLPSQPFFNLAPATLPGVTYDVEGLVIAPRPLSSSNDQHQTSESDTYGREYFDLVLSGEPAATTTVVCSSSDPLEGVVTSATTGEETGTFVFTSDNWDTPVRVRIAGVADDVKEDSASYSVSCTASSPCTDSDSNSTVTCFDGETSSSFSLVNYDRNEVGVVLDMSTLVDYDTDSECSANQPASLISCPMTPSGCGTVRLIQGAPAATVSVVLLSEPYTAGAEVVVTASVTPADSASTINAAITITPATFDSSNWNVPQEISISLADVESADQPPSDVPLEISFFVDGDSTTDGGFGGTYGGYSDCADDEDCFNLKYGTVANTQSMCGLFQTNRTIIEYIASPDDGDDTDNGGLPDSAIYGIIGGVLGLIIVIILIILILACEREKKIRKLREEEAQVKNDRLDAADHLEIDFRLDNENDLDIDQLSSQLNEVNQRLARERNKLKAENELLAAKAGESGISSTLADTEDANQLVNQIKQLKVDNDRLREMSNAPTRPKRKKPKTKKADFGQSAQGQPVREYEMSKMNKDNEGRV